MSAVGQADRRRIKKDSRDFFLVSEASETKKMVITLSEFQGIPSNYFSRPLFVFLSFFFSHMFSKYSVGRDLTKKGIRNCTVVLSFT
jgi:hypothetical protein